MIFSVIYQSPERHSEARPINVRYDPKHLVNNRSEGRTSLQSNSGFVVEVMEYVNELLIES